MVRSRDGLASQTAKAGIVLAVVCALMAAPALAQAPDPAPPPPSGPQPDAAPGAQPTPSAPPPPVVQAPPPVVTQAPAPPVTQAPAPTPTATTPPPVSTPAPTTVAPQPAVRAVRHKPHRAVRHKAHRAAHRDRTVPAATQPGALLAQADTSPTATTRPAGKSEPPLPEPLRERRRDPLLIGSALAMLAVAASTLLLLAQAKRIRRELGTN
jgi:hypothetical protein